MRRLEDGNEWVWLVMQQKEKMDWGGINKALLHPTPYYVQVYEESLEKRERGSKPNQSRASTFVDTVWGSLVSACKSNSLIEPRTGGREMRRGKNSNINVAGPLRGSGQIESNARSKKERGVGAGAEEALPGRIQTRILGSTGTGPTVHVGRGISKSGSSP
jgi:hypothetical protein